MQVAREGPGDLVGGGEGCLEVLVASGSIETHLEIAVGLGPGVGGLMPTARRARDMTLGSLLVIKGLGRRYSGSTASLGPGFTIVAGPAVLTSSRPEHRPVAPAWRDWRRSVGEGPPPGHRRWRESPCR